MLVWQDMVSGGAGDSLLITRVLPFMGIHLKDHRYRLFGRADSASRAQLEKECADTVSLLYNCTSLCLWVPLNEVWGQFDARRIGQMMRHLTLPVPSTTPAAGTISGPAIL